MICALNKAKNLYNGTLYAVRQHYFQTKKFLNYQQINKIFVQAHNEDYYALPAKVSQQVQRLVYQNFKSFFVLQEESYTSKCSFLDRETITYHAVYAGKRVKRGLFRTKQGLLLNADVNGSYNIMKKYLKVVRNIDVYTLVDLIEACSTPAVFTVKI